MWGLMPPIDEPFFQKGTNSLFTLLYKPRRRWRIFFSFYLLLALTILLVTSTYTWFSISRTPRVTDMRMYISAGVGLSLAENFDDQPEDWGQSLDFQELIGTDTVLRPATWSVQSGGLVTADYGRDGRILGTFPPFPTAPMPTGATARATMSKALSTPGRMPLWRYPWGKRWS